VALATLLTQDPPLALLDEPLAHLDLTQQLRMLALLADEVATRQRTVMMSVHDLSLAQRVATHVLLLAGDGDAQAGTVDEVMTEPVLSRAFGHTLHRHQADGRVWWLPA
jgi:iron complex transport system ATP-binding protein